LLILPVEINLTGDEEAVPSALAVENTEVVQALISQLKLLSPEMKLLK
jgi:hypothetical protein